MLQRFDLDEYLPEYGMGALVPHIRLTGGVSTLRELMS
jgi:hypothetical protein